MKCLTQLPDLNQYGIFPLTGESDNLQFRILCDVNNRGYTTICQALGMRPQPREPGETPVGWAESWNNGIASILLSHLDLTAILVIALLENGCHSVLINEHGQAFGFEGSEVWDASVPGLAAKEGDKPFWPSCYGKPLQLIESNRNHSSVGDRNVHQMTGRTS